MKHPKILIVISILLLNNILNSKEIEVKINPKLNQTTNYNALLKNMQKRNGELLNNSTEYKFSITLIENSADGLLFSWKIKKIITKADLKGVSKELEKINEGLEIKFYTSQTGIYKAVENWDEILNYFEKKLNKIEEDFWGDPNAKVYVAKLKKSLLKPEQLSEYLLPEIILIHNFYGAKLELNKEVINTLMIKDSYLSIELPVINQSKIELSKGNYVFEINEKIDQLRSNKIIKTYSKENDLEAVSYSNFQNFKFIYNSNFKLLHLEYQKEVKINNDEMVKYIVISEDK